MNSCLTPFSNLEQIISKLNFFGINFPIRYRREKKYLSYMGILFSLITLILIISLSIKYIFDLFNYKNFIVIQNEINLDKTKILDLSNSQIMVGLINNHGNPYNINNKFFNIIMSKQSFSPFLNNNNNINNKNFNGLNIINNIIKFDFCNISELNYDMSFYKDFNFDNYLCPKKNESLFIKGRYGDIRKGFDIINIYIEKCINSTENNNFCESEEKINKILNNSYLSLYFIQETPNHYNVNNPIKKELRTDYFQINLNIKKLYLYNFIINDYYSDNGLFFPNKKKFSFPQINSLHLDTINFKEPNSELQIIFTCDDYQNEFYRKYNKIYDMCSNIGGILNFIFQFFQYLVCYFTEKIFIGDLNLKIVNLDYFKKGNNYLLNDIMKSKNNINNSKSEMFSKNHLIFKNNLPNKNNKIKLSNIISHNRRFFQNNIHNFLKIANYKIPIYSYFLPFFIMKKYNKFIFLKYTSDFYKSFMSLENIIPIIERFPHVVNFINDKFNFSYENEFFKYYYLEHVKNISDNINLY